MENDSVDRLLSGPLDSYRKQATFDCREMKNIFEENPEYMQIKVSTARFFNFETILNLMKTRIGSTVSTIILFLDEPLEDLEPRPNLQKTQKYSYHRRTEETYCKKTAPLLGNEFFSFKFCRIALYQKAETHDDSK